MFCSMLFCSMLFHSIWWPSGMQSQRYMTTPCTDINDIAWCGMLQWITEKSEELQFSMATPNCSTPNRTCLIMSISSLVEYGVKADSVALKYYKQMENASLLSFWRTLCYLYLHSPSIPSKIQYSVKLWWQLFMRVHKKKKKKILSNIPNRTRRFRSSFFCSITTKLQCITSQKSNGLIYTAAEACTR